MAVYINNTGSDTATPRMIEFFGNFAFDGKAKEKRFDTFFDPNVFRRIHIRNGLGQSAMNLARPCRESDVLVLHAPGDSFYIRFMVPAPKLKPNVHGDAGGAPAKRPAGQDLLRLRPTPAPASVLPPAEKIAGPKVDPMLGGRSLNKEIIQKHLKAGHKMFIRTIPPPLVLAALQANHVYRVTDYTVNGNGNDDVVSLQSPTTDQRPQAIMDFIHRATLLWWVEE